MGFGSCSRRTFHSGLEVLSSGNESVRTHKKENYCIVFVKANAAASSLGDFHLISEL